MATAGIVGQYKGSQAREVMMTIEEYENIRRQMEIDSAAGYEDLADDQNDEDQNDDDQNETIDADDDDEIAEETEDQYEYEQDDDNASVSSLQQ